MWITADYLKLASRCDGHTPHDLRAAFALHEAFMETGDMLQADFARYY